IGAQILSVLSTRCGLQTGTAVYQRPADGLGLGLLGEIGDLVDQTLDFWVLDVQSHDGVIPPKFYHPLETHAFRSRKPDTFGQAPQIPALRYGAHRATRHAVPRPATIPGSEYSVPHA